jgi:hypothetical protein
MTDEKVQRRTRRRLWTGLIIMLALVGMGVLLVRSLTPRMEGMGPTGSMPMPENAPNDMQGMDMEGMDMGGMDMGGMDMSGDMGAMDANSQEQSPSNP